MTAPSRRVHIANEVEKGKNALRAGEELLGLGLFDDAVSRLYYAAFHFACAALLTEGIEATSHHGVFTQFSQHLVRTGKVPSARAKDLRRLQGYREAADCEHAFTFTREGAGEEAEVARTFVAAMRELLAAGGWI